MQTCPNRSTRPLSANSCREQCSKQRPYSITSSARPSMVGGTVMPSAFAVLRLMTSSNLVGPASGSANYTKRIHVASSVSPDITPAVVYTSVFSVSDIILRT